MPQKYDIFLDYHFFCSYFAKKCITLHPKRYNPGKYFADGKILKNEIMNDFEEYIRQGEPGKVRKSQIWQTAIGLQQVDGLTPSAYLIEIAKENIEGKITIDEVQTRIDSYYETLNSRDGVSPSQNDRTEEADKVAARITKLLGHDTFSFSPIAYLSIHKQLFRGIYKFAGKIRDYNIRKSEWVLDGKTVLYTEAAIIWETLEFDFKQEAEFNYSTLDNRGQVEHIVKFISGLWQIHAFGEGNTRTTAVFAIQYLRVFGFKVENDMFARHSWYFRNALVRANFNDYEDAFYATPKYLMYFFGNLLLGENHILKNRYMHIKFVDNVTDTVNADKNGGQEKLGVKLGVNVKKLGVKLGVNQIKMIDIIQSNQNVTIVEIAQMLNISTTATENNIKKLKSLGILSREGADKNGYWKIHI